MVSITVDKIPSKLSFKTNEVDFKTFAIGFIEYMENTQDIEKVKNEMKNNTESFDYESIRGNYV